MTATLKNLAATAVLLPPKDREYLAERLLASLDETATEQQWMAEAKRRRDEVRSGRVQAVPAEEVYHRIDRSCPREAGFLSTAHTPADINQTVRAPTKVMKTL